MILWASACNVEMHLRFLFSEVLMKLCFDMLTFFCEKLFMNFWDQDLGAIPILKVTRGKQIRFQANLFQVPGTWEAKTTLFGKPKNNF